MILQRMLLAAWMIASGLTILWGEKWLVDNRFDPAPERVQLWLSYSTAIFIAAAGSFYTSWYWRIRRATANWAWTIILAVSLIAYGFFALRTLLPAQVHDVPLGELTSDTIEFIWVLRAIVAMLIGKLCWNERQAARNAPQLARAGG